jgi:hypothetical protein
MCSAQKNTSVWLEEEAVRVIEADEEERWSSRRRKKWWEEEQRTSCFFNPFANNSTASRARWEL